MQPHQERVVAEQADLAEKVTKLHSFIGGDIYNSLDKDEQQRLVSQITYMRGYNDVLLKRIQAFG